MFQSADGLIALRNILCTCRRLLASSCALELEESSSQLSVTGQFIVQFSWTAEGNVQYTADSTASSVCLGHFWSDGKPPAVRWEHYHETTLPMSELL